MITISFVETFEIGLWRDKEAGGGNLVSQQSSQSPQNYYKHNAISDRHCTETPSLELGFELQCNANMQHQTTDCDTEKTLCPKSTAPNTTYAVKNVAQ